MRNKSKELLFQLDDSGGLHETLFDCIDILFYGPVDMFYEQS